MKLSLYHKIIWRCCCISLLLACEKPTVKKEFKCLEVRASAYNSVSWQTNGNPNVGAWGDTLKENSKIIAVSRNLIDSGLVHNQVVSIQGLEGEYVVKDKMHYRWRNKIDVFFGKDVAAARNWGVKKVAIRWEPK